MEHLKKLSVSSQAWTIQPPGSQSVTSSSRSVTSWSSRSLRRKPRILNADQYICDKLYRLKCRIVVLLNFMNLNISVRKFFIYCRIFFIFTGFIYATNFREKMSESESEGIFSGHFFYATFKIRPNLLTSKTQFTQFWKVFKLLKNYFKLSNSKNEQCVIQVFGPNFDSFPYVF